jgi:hypothetical protein
MDMRLKHHPPIRPCALAATAAMIATTLALAFGAEVGLAADYQDAKHNVCEGTFSTGSCSWGFHVTGEVNVALGDAMMPALTSGGDNVALDFGALSANTTGGDNIAIGVGALLKNTTGNNNLALSNSALAHNTTGFNNLASGLDALVLNTEGSNNLASGVGALEKNTSGIENIATGTNALRSNTTGTDNTALGTFALESNTIGHANIATGNDALQHNTTGDNNVASGVRALNLNTTGGGNIASGSLALEHNTTGNNNTASGSLALEHNTTGNNNTASGLEALFNNTGSSNVALGSLAGKNLTTGSNNIDIANEGVAAEEGATRIGSEGKQTKAFVAGVYKKTVTTPACAVKVNSEGQLGCNPEENSTAIATFASRTKTLSGNCLAYTDIGPAGSGACPATTTGFSSSTRLAGPTPANGATVTNLYADSSATVTGIDTVLVAVIDNTTGTTLLSCTLTSSTPHSCSNASESGAAAAGENIEVKLTATGPSGNEKPWRVTFRF